MLVIQMVVPMPKLYFQKWDGDKEDACVASNDFNNLKVQADDEKRGKSDHWMMTKT